MHITYVTNLSGASKRLPIPGKKVYIGNAATVSTITTTAAEIPNATLSGLASGIREDLRT